MRILHVFFVKGLVGTYWLVACSGLRVRRGDCRAAGYCSPEPTTPLRKGRNHFNWVLGFIIV